MIQTVATILFLLLGASGMLVIAASLADDWGAFRHALGLGDKVGGLPPRMRVPSPQRARVVRISPAGSSWRAAA